MSKKTIYLDKNDRFFKKNTKNSKKMTIFYKKSQFFLYFLKKNVFLNKKTYY